MLRASYEGTWTKLRVFEVLDFDIVCFLDADMVMRSNMDAVFSAIDDLPQNNMAASYDCTCNIEKAAWAPEQWCKETCAFTPLAHPDALSQPIQPTEDSPDTHHVLNSGMFFFRPSESLRDRLLKYFRTTDELSSFKKPDEDFLSQSLDQSAVAVQCETADEIYSRQDLAR